MSEQPTYRVHGDDWDPVAPEAREAREPVSWPESAPEVPADPEPASEAAAAPAELPRIDSGDATPVAPGADGPAPPPTRLGPPRTVRVSASSSAGAVAPAGATSPTRLAELTRRLPPPIGPALERVPPRLLLGGAGLGVAAVAIMILFSGSPAGVAATPSATPTALVPVATPSCAELAVPLPIPNLLVTEPGGGQHRLGGVAPGEGAVVVDGPWPAELGPIEASVPLGSTLRLTVTGACIGEWRAVAAHPPETLGQPWRPAVPETQQLGWQSAERVAWEPSVPLPPRGEWIVRVTVWFREPDGPSAEATAASEESPASLPEADRAVERYYRLVVEAPDS